MKAWTFLLALLLVTSVSAGMDIIGPGDSTTDRVVNLVTPPTPAVTNTTIGNVNSSTWWGNYLWTDYDMPSILSYTYNQTTPFTNWLSTFVYNYNQTVLYYSDEDWINKNATNAFVFNESKLATTYYNATQSNTVTGTVVGGIEKTQHQDGKYDGDTLNITEASGMPGLDLRINFTGITTFNAGVMRYKTSSLAGDYPIIQLWNYDTSDWEAYPAVAESEFFATIEQPVFDSTDHVSGGVVQMRLYKASNGNTQNKYYVDWIAISKGFGTPSGEEVDPYSIHRDGSTSWIGNENGNGFNSTGWDNIGALNWSNVTITESQISDLQSYLTGMDYTNLILSNQSNTYSNGTGLQNFSNNNIITTGKMRVGPNNDYEILHDGTANDFEGLEFFDSTGTSLRAQMKALWSNDGATEYYVIGSGGWKGARSLTLQLMASNAEMTLTGNTPRINLAGKSGGSGGKVLQLFHITQDNTDGGLGAQNWGDIGIYGSGKTAPIPPSVVYWFWDASPSSAYNNATIKLTPDDKFGINIPNTTAPAYPLEVRKNVSGITIWSEGSVNASTLTARDGYTGSCINASYVGGIVTGCND